MNRPIEAIDSGRIAETNPPMADPMPAPMSSGLSSERPAIRQNAPPIAPRMISAQPMNVRKPTQLSSEFRAAR